MEMSSNTSKIVAVVVLVVVALVSIFGVSSVVSKPEFHKGSLKLLDDKKMTVVALTGTAALASGAISMVPGDATSPIANEIMDIASYLLMITGVIFLEKILLTLSGLIAFRFLIPIACILGIIFIFWKKDVLKNLAIKLSIFGIILFLIVPISTYLSSWLENNYKDTINVTTESIENIEVEDNKEEKEQEKGIINGIKNKAQDITENITSGVSDGLEKAKQYLSNLIDAIAVLVITTCVIPVIVLIFMIWILKIIFGINIPVKKITKKKASAKESKEDVKAEE